MKRWIKNSVACLALLSTSTAAFAELGTSTHGAIVIDMGVATELLDKIEYTQPFSPSERDEYSQEILPQLNLLAQNFPRTADYLKGFFQGGDPLWYFTRGKLKKVAEPNSKSIVIASQWKGEYVAFNWGNLVQVVQDVFDHKLTSDTRPTSRAMLFTHEVLWRATGHTHFGINPELEVITPENIRELTALLLNPYFFKQDAVKIRNRIFGLANPWIRAEFDSRKNGLIKNKFLEYQGANQFKQAIEACYNSSDDTEQFHLKFWCALYLDTFASDADFNKRANKETDREIYSQSLMQAFKSSETYQKILRGGGVILDDTNVNLTYDKTGKQLEKAWIYVFSSHPKSLEAPSGFRYIDFHQIILNPMLHEQAPQIKTVVLTFNDLTGSFFNFRLSPHSNGKDFALSLPPRTEAYADVPIEIFANGHSVVSKVNQELMRERFTFVVNDSDWGSETPISTVYTPGLVVLEGKVSESNVIFGSKEYEALKSRIGQ